jgi:hypothetical protein
MKRYGTTTVSATISHKQRAFLSNRCRHLHWLIVYTLASIFFCLPAVADKPEPIAKGPELKVTLSALEPGNSHVLFTMTNISDKPVSILRWTTPFSSTLEGDMFVVTRQGKNQRRVGYSGRLVKRGGPTNDDYFVLQPGESLSREIDVLFGYAARIAGKYTIQFQHCLTRELTYTY